VATDRAKQLRTQGIAAAKAGQKDQARQMLQQSLQIEPRNEAAWLWLISLARDSRERLFYLNRLLEINPANEMALQSLQQLGLTRQQLAEQVSSLPQKASNQAALAASQEPGVPAANPNRLNQIQPELDNLVREYLAPPTGYPRIVWQKKTRARAGERDVILLRAIIAGIVASVLIILFAVSYTVVWNTPALRGIVFVPTRRPPTLTPTPTFTPTPTPGSTPTPSLTPQVSVTPSPTVPANLPSGRQSAPQPTEIYPPVFEKGVRESVLLLDQGDSAQALPTLQMEITAVQRSFDPAPYYYAALAMADQGDLTGALDLLAQAEERLPEKPNDNFAPLIDAGQAYVNLLLAERQLEAGSRVDAEVQLVTVEEYARAAIAADPRLEQPYLTLARRFMLIGNEDNALKALDDGLAVPDLAGSTRLLIAKGEVLFAQGEYDQADYQAFLALYVDPTVETAHRLRVQAAMSRGEPGLAVLYAQTYLFYWPGSPDAYTLLGEARAAEGNIDLALAAYSRALLAGPNARVLVDRAALYSSLGRDDLALADLNAALELGDDPAVRAQRMQAAYHSGDYATASADIDALRGSGAVSPAELDFLAARIAIDTARDGDTEAITAALDQIDALAGRLPQALAPTAQEYRARALFQLQRYADALEAVDSLLSAQNSASGHYLRGLILQAQGDRAGAQREYEWVLTWSQFYTFPFIEDVRTRLDALRP
jgi:tetratricopeptide (TPR) repeat protein